MKDCWKILGINPTNDLEVIKKRRRSLIKEFHPDNASTPEKIRKNTIRCAQINDAYDTAVATVRSTLRSGPESSKPKSEKWVSSLADVIGVLIGLLGTIGIYALVWYFMSDSFSPHNPVRIITKTIMFLAIGIFLFGFVLLGLLDHFISYFLLELQLFKKIRLEKYENKLTWLTVLSVNVGLLVIYPLFIGAGTSEQALADDPLNWFYFGLMRVSAALAVPLLFLYSWIQDYINYRRVNHDIVFLEPSN